MRTRPGHRLFQIDIPPGWKQQLLEHLNGKGSLNDLCVTALALELGESFVPSGKIGRPGFAPVLVLEMPEQLRERIHAEALQAGVSGMEIARRALQKQLGLEP